jgi:hypothetical protein
MIKDLVESGDKIGAQKVILGELDKQLGGTAEASADASKKIKVVADELKEAFGKEFLGSLGNAADIISETDDGASSLGTTVGILTKKAFALDEIIGFVGTAMDDTATAADILGSAWNYVAGVVSPLSNKVLGVDDALKFTVETAGKAASRLADLAEETQEARKAMWKAQGPTAKVSGLLYKIRDAGVAASDATETLTDDTYDLASAMQAQADPVFNALDAYERYNDMLLRIDDDGERTADEMLDLAGATLDVAAAFDSLDTENVEDAMETLSGALGISKDEAHDLLVELGLLDGKTITTKVLVDFRNRIGGGEPAVVTSSGREAFATGGVVPGQRGQASLAVVHGGETISTPNQRGGGTVNNFYIDGALDPVAVAAQIQDLLDLYGRTNGLV